MSYSFVIPCYCSSHTIREVVESTIQEMERIDRKPYEFILVDDHSPDEGATLQELKALANEYSCVKAIELAKNSGQHNASIAGMNYAKGDYIISMDDDLQTRPSQLPKLFEEIEKGYDVVYGYYPEKKHSRFRNFGSWVNEKMLEKMLNKPHDLYVSSYFAMRRFVADEVLRYQNSYPYLLGLVLRTTKNIVNVPVHHRRREIGNSGYTFGKLLALWMNGFTAFSIKPLRLGTALGAACSALAFVYAIYTIVKKMVNPAVPVGFSALMTAIVFFGGMILLMLGLAGEYIGRTYISVNSAPQYVIRETTGKEEY